MTTGRLVSELAREATLAQRVETELERLILESRLGEGDRLPSERELATQFRVSRTVVREAVRALAARRLVDVGVGRGTVVRAPSAQSAGESMRLLLRMQAGGADTDKVSEVRRILEDEIAALAAARRTESDVRALGEILAEAGRHLDDPDAFIKTDVAFHSRLARATQNELFVLILDSLVEVMTEVRLLGLRIPGTARRALEHHSAVFEAVRAGDPEHARRTMDAHMDEAADTLRRAVSNDPETPGGTDEDA
jgi:GntR family transcriptional regulator, transcriptional repressor for pyruvate dehydrogenase complex